MPAFMVVNIKRRHHLGFPQSPAPINGKDSFQLSVGVFDTCLVWYLLVLPSETHAVANMTSLRAIDGGTSYNSLESFSFPFVP